MASIFHSLTDANRAALLRFEKSYGEWCCASERALDAGAALWGELLRHRAGPDATAAAEAARLRRQAEAAYLETIEALRDCDP